MKQFKEERKGTLTTREGEQKELLLMAGKDPQQTFTHGNQQNSDCNPKINNRPPPAEYIILSGDETEEKLPDFKGSLWLKPQLEVM